MSFQILVLHIELKRLRFLWRVFILTKIDNDSLYKRISSDIETEKKSKESEYKRSECLFADQILKVKNIFKWIVIIYLLVVLSIACLTAYEIFYVSDLDKAITIDFAMLGIGSIRLALLDFPIAFLYIYEVN